jgi:hypothetical protein
VPYVVLGERAAEFLRYEHELASLGMSCEE